MVKIHKRFMMSKLGCNVFSTEFAFLSGLKTQTGVDHKEFLKYAINPIIQYNLNTHISTKDIIEFKLSRFGIHAGYRLYSDDDQSCIFSITHTETFKINETFHPCHKHPNLGILQLETTDEIVTSYKQKSSFSILSIISNNMITSDGISKLEYSIGIESNHAALLAINHLILMERLRCIITFAKQQTFHILSQINDKKELIALTNIDDLIKNPLIGDIYKPAYNMLKENQFDNGDIFVLETSLKVLENHTVGMINNFLDGKEGLKVELDATDTIKECLSLL